MLRRKRPCEECPWRRDTEPGQFPAERYEALRATAPGPRGESVEFGRPMFACHKSTEDEPCACAGWLAVVGHAHVGVRLSVATGDLPVEALEPDEDWPELYSSYDEMADAQGRASDSD